MCLILVAWRVHADFPLVVAANRDEFYARPTLPAGHWPDAPQVIAGRDLEAGGTWLGITESGRFAAVTNVREPGAPQGRRSRGDLTRHFLTSAAAPLQAAQAIDGADYSGFNLLLAAGDNLCYLSNRDSQPRLLAPGIYGVSNHLLDTPWPKLASAKTRFAEALAHLPAAAPFFAILADDEIVPDAVLPSTGVPLEWERLLSAVFVKSETYGTRASTLLTVARDGAIRLEERSYGQAGKPLQSSVISTGV